ncbi:MAG: heavy metal-responsive transcriptional regulator [Gammaproteobacteria bacterium]|nr:heavy metal-responsive transcriptional regulator [Gammaproteobacteria bacterium]
MRNVTIGEVARQLAMSVDTLRYYEKIGLLPKVSRTESGIRRYSEKDISRLKFIKRAQQMNFTLAEISDLMTMRAAPQYARTEIRQLTTNKLREVELRLTELNTLRRELVLLVNLCTASDDSCPIIDRIEEGE